jgi:crossover junction endodeoxyribonuclease RuvC
MIYLGIDPGTATTGFGVIEKSDGKQLDRSTEYKILEFGVISTEKTQTDAERLKILYNDISALIKKHSPGRIGIEKLFFNSNQTTAMTVSQARGVILLACSEANVPIIEFTPLQVKSTLCGYGNADKKQVQFMVQQTFKLKKIPTPDDAADALAIAICCANWKLIK